IYLPIRAADRPFINLADPSTPQRFDDYIQRRQYKTEQVTSMFTRRGNFFEHQLGYHFLRYFSWQWFKSDSVNRMTGIPAQVVNVFGGLFVAFLGLFGAVFHCKQNKHSFFYFLAIFFCTSLLMVFVMNLSSAEVRDRDYFFVAAYNMWAIWLGIGAMGLVSLFKNDKLLRVVMAILMLFLPIFNMAAQYFEHNRSHELIALDYGVNFLNSMEENAIIFTNGDNDTYPIWYAQAVKDPYAEPYIHKAREVYPTAESQEAIQIAREYKNQQCKGIRKDVTVANLSLLNTSWYIRQLRDLEGVIINWSEDEINSLDDRYGSFQDLLWKDQVTFDAGDPEGKMKFTINYRENYENRETTGAFYPLKGSDYAVIQIIKDNFGKRPIYFAVTCESRVGFDDYLRNEGMVSRVVSTYDPVNEQIDIDRLLTNIDKVYKYRSIFDPKVYKDDNMKRLVMNYGSGYSRAAVYFAKNHQFDKAEQYAKKARAFIDSDIRLTEFYVTYYIEKGELDKLDAFIENNIWGNADEISIYRAYVLRYVMENRRDLAPRYLAKIMTRYPDDPELGAIALAYGYQYKQMAQINALFDSLRDILHYTPEDIYRSIQEEMSPE
ncbi:MAG: sulfite exporter TauE/SafE family protein, partial [Candidatus Syntrophosphaera sp.]|nr:sulfite exporter TauE/SafE family protein [Candidatus Syntrophosphaera sp.]